MMQAQQMRERTCSRPPVRKSTDARPLRPASSSCGRLHPGQGSVADQDRQRRSGSQQCTKSAVLLRHDPGADPTPTKHFIDYSPGPDSVSRVMRMRAIQRDQPRDAESARPPDCPEAGHESRSRSGRHRCESVEPEGLFKGTLIRRCAVDGNKDADSKPRVLIPPDAHRCHKAVGPRCGAPKSRTEPDPQFPTEVKQRSKRGKTTKLHSSSKGKVKAKLSSSKSFPSFTEMISEKSKKKCRVSFATEERPTRNFVNDRREKGREAGAAIAGESEKQFADSEDQEPQLQSPTVAESVSEDRDRGRTASDQAAVTGKTQWTQVNHWEDRQNLNQVKSSQVNESSPPEHQQVDKDADNSSELESQSGVAYMEPDQQTKKGEEADQQQSKEQALPQSTDECHSYVIEMEHQNSTGSSEQQKSDENVCKDRQPRVSDPSAGTQRARPNAAVLIYKTEIETYIEDDDEEGDCEEEEGDVQEHQAEYELSEQQTRDQPTFGDMSGTVEQRKSREHTLREQSQKQPKRESYQSGGEQRKNGFQTNSAGAQESARKSCQGEQRRSDVYRQQESEKTEDASWPKAGGSGAEQGQIARLSSGQPPLQVADEPTENGRNQQRWPESSAGRFEQQAPGCEQSEIPDTCQEALRQDAERRRRRELADSARAAVLSNMLVKRTDAPAASDAKEKASKVEEVELEQAARGGDMHSANIYGALLPKQPEPDQQRQKPTCPRPKCPERAMDIKWVREGQTVVKLANGMPSGIRVISRCRVMGDIYGSCEQSPTEKVAVESDDIPTDVDQLVSDKDSIDKDAEENDQGTTEDTGDPVLRHKKKCCGC